MHEHYHCNRCRCFKPKELPLKISDEIKEKFIILLKILVNLKNQTIGVFGGGDSALDLALEVANMRNVKLIHRRDQFHGLESNVKN